MRDRKLLDQTLPGKAIGTLVSPSIEVYDLAAKKSPQSSADGAAREQRYGHERWEGLDEKEDLLNACLALEPAHILHDLIDIPWGHAFDLRHVAKFPMVRCDAIGCST